MKLILIVIPVISVVIGAVNGKIGDISSAIIDKAGEAVTLCISICGIMCFWCGLMKVAERSGLVDKLAGLISPLVGLMFRDIKRGGKAAGLICMNLAANLFGLGNASTPLGIKAMQAIREETEETQSGDYACDSMIMLAVLNTASLQLIPTTAAALRAANGAGNPMEILPCVWAVSAYSVTVAVLAAKLLGAFFRRSERKRRAKNGA